MAKKKQKTKKEPEVTFDMDSSRITTEIPINCSYTHLIPLNTLIPTQGNLKVSKGESLDKLEKSFDTLGFIKPIVLWHDTSKDEATTQLLDGHQRRKLLIRMALKGKSTKYFKIPVIYSHADTKEKAMEILLHLVEQTGDITQDGLLKFSEEHKISLKEISEKMSLKSPALAAAKKKLEEKKIAQLQEDPEYPIQPFFAEKYSSVTIFCKNELDEVWLRNFLKMHKTKDYNSTYIGESNVITVETFQELIEEFENNLRAQTEKEDDSDK